MELVVRLEFRRGNSSAEVVREGIVLLGSRRETGREKVTRFQDGLGFNLNFTKL